MKATVTKVSFSELKEEDKNKMRDINAKNEYGVDYDQLLALVENHRKARKQGNEYKCALIEYRLTDINFHSEVSMLNAGKYDELKQLIEEEF